MSVIQFFPGFVLLGCLLLPVTLQADDFQYQFEAISVPKATADEPVRTQLSIEAAAKYLEHGSAAWNGQRKCVSCHTNGTYMTIRPQLSRTLGPRMQQTESSLLSSCGNCRQNPWNGSNSPLGRLR